VRNALLALSNFMSGSFLISIGFAGGSRDIGLIAEAGMAFLGGGANVSSTSGSS
jgi:hypothetical protein